MQKLAIIIILFAAMVPVFYIHRWLKRLISPRRSPGRFLLYLLVVLELVFLYTFLIVWVIANLFDPPKG